MTSQLSLFGDADAVDPAGVTDDVRRLGRSLPAAIHLGTSSWSFPGWTGLVFAPRNGKPATEQVLARHGLPAYAAHPLLRTVSLDRTFYAPLTREEFAAYAAQVPEAFRFVVKAVLRGRMPRSVTLAVEVRDPELACSSFAAGLRDSGAVPCLAVHARMPPVAEQAAAFGVDRDDCHVPLVARWNLHAGHRYEEAKQAYFPFNRLIQEDPPTRTILASLAARAAAHNTWKSAARRNAR